MPLSDDDSAADAEARLWVRPFTITNGRTRPGTALELMSLVKATGRITPENLRYEHAQVLRLCQSPTSVAEVAALLKEPVMVTKVLLSDLIELGAAATRAPSAADSTDLALLEALLDGLQRL